MNQQEGLLFRFSGENGLVPEFAAGNSTPNFLKDVEIIEDGMHGGKALRCHPTQLFAFWAPGNIYSQQGTISFFWRPRTPLGETEFPLFRVSFADHSSWDALFARIDYNGSGIEAFVTDINLSRLRVCAPFKTLPAPDEWIHIAFSWDETAGVRLYVNGVQKAAIHATALLNAGLDQFGTHSRIISNAQVQSSYNYMRTGDFDDITIFDRMLSQDHITSLFHGTIPSPEKRLPSLADAAVNSQWQRRYGFDHAVPPSPLVHPFTTVRKVEIHQAWDLKRWWWKGCDGIRENTWPGVYNRSRLPGRLDYFILPDWDCYSLSGKSITFEPLADEEWNHMEMSGSAQGEITIEGRMELQGKRRRTACERSVMRLAEPVRNVSVTFTNDEIEEPIGDITLLNVTPGCVPPEAAEDAFSFQHKADEASPAYKEVAAFIKGRHMPSERSAPFTATEADLPLYHLVMPYPQRADVGMDGMRLCLPPLFSADGSEGDFLVNVQIKDPLWLYRNMMNFTFSLRQGIEKVIWFDLRDRILPDGKALYASISFSKKPRISELKAIQTSIVYKPYVQAKAEHVADRWIQVKDNYANMVEENPSTAHFNMFNRFKADLMDLLRIDPTHTQALQYYYDKFKENKPAFVQTACPETIPLWAWRQREYLDYVKRFLRWWIDKRQIENGEFGGGLSDDGDLTAWWPGPAMVGCMPQKIKQSLLTQMEAFYEQGMFANGLCAIQTDQLHTLEEGIQVLGQCLTLEPWSPKHVERAMENARGLSFITGITQAGHRHVLSGYYSGTRIAQEPAWAYSASDSFHVFHPTYMLARYNNSPDAKRLILETADGMMAHFDGTRLHVQIDLASDQASVHERTREWPLFYAAWNLSGDEKYLQAIYDASLLHKPQDRLPKTADEQNAAAAEQYEALIEAAAHRQYLNTDGQLWVDRCVIDIAALQQHRIGGIAHERFALYPRHSFRWKFPDGTETDVAVLVTYAAKEEINLRAFNMTDTPITAEMTLEDVSAGEWQVSFAENTFATFLERFSTLPVTFAPMSETELSLKLLHAEAEEPRADLALDSQDVLVSADCIRVRVHNIGAVASETTILVLKDSQGRILRKSNIPPIPAPVDLYPKVLEIPLYVRGLDLTNAYVEIDPQQQLREITRRNNRIDL